AMRADPVQAAGSAEHEILGPHWKDQQCERRKPFLARNGIDHQADDAAGKQAEHDVDSPDFVCWIEPIDELGKTSLDKNPAGPGTRARSSRVASKVRIEDAPVEK